jgi:pimeloyl-ACP methyl ester carboxylesterase
MSIEPQIRYALRPDGVRTAYAVFGSGPILVIPPGGTTHIEWYVSETEAQTKFCSRLAEHRTLVLYDRHGCGLSDRNRKAFTPEDDLLDLEAVISAVGGGSIDLFGISWGGSPALAYAAQRPERVDKLVLYGTGADSSRRDENTHAAMVAWNALRRADPEAYFLAQAARFFPSGADPETFRSLVRMLRDSTSEVMAVKLQDVVFDTRAVLSRISTPTLVLHRKGDVVCPFRWGQYLARRLPNAQFVPLEGDAHYPWVGDADSILRPTLEFLTRGAPGARSNPPASSGTAVILFTDIVSSTALTERMGDARFRDASRALDAGLRAAIRDAGGAAIEGKLLGDGVLATFPSAAQAIDGARRCLALSAASELGLHIGLHAGDVIREDNNVYGGAVNIASRICGLSAPGEILVSDVVRGMARSSAGVEFEDRGEQEMKGVGEPVRVYAVREDGA